MTARDYDLVVFGATSFVGQILTRYLSEYLSSGTETLRWAIAGRSESKLKSVRDSLGAAGQSLPIIVADAADEAQLQAMCARTRVVVSTVGPYALYGEPLVKVCAQSGTDYCDLTGETPWIRKMVDRYEPAARQSGARIVHCCGFDSVPSDMGVYFLQQQAKQQWGVPATHVKMRIKTLKGGASGGTVASMLNVVQEAVANPALRKELLNPYSLCPKDHGFTARQHYVKSAEFDADYNAWIAPFVMAAINERVVHRSNALADKAYGSQFTYDEAIMTGTGIKGRLSALAVVAGLGAFMLGAVVKPIRIAMERFLLPKPGEGPSPEAQLAGRYDLRFFGRTDDGRTLRVKVTGDRDPGYGSTGKMLGQAAIGLALDYATDDVKVGRPGGFWTPATMFDERFIERLVQHAGLRFELA
ncbi:MULTISPECIES: trans-acting enoyl reductase family protein [Paraburkholderia]|uniref:saccharopine dehydrogenase family protein n=1 Tax=Paraburkholderia TaxID=1822464 RepID=UPI002250A944|nr:MULTISPECIES: saccharopine dehydrogenase NADP-binding domain-containing protein [Paraburkholderia]MCX4163037.1 saccharopine dehydrogenase NADP-binding domain-containing protein [Paraburkholderia megapolitana]MDN7158533.1 saccharopine dehydrogenase NADP-binding domain-containing protein [Paraburkholderia sp. CHISQ3]MDQ6495580.1 saccharopine dehydrogenase NADP-binding domain-containing protein [Paraburkholderia megapolitana]